jgi:cathepsin L
MGIALLFFACHHRYGKGAHGGSYVDVTGYWMASAGAADSLRKDELSGRNPLFGLTKAQQETIVREANLPRYDARDSGYLPAVRTQNTRCNSCWAYSAIGILEVSYIRRNHVASPAAFQLSTQQIADCGNFYRDCYYGARTNEALTYLKTQNIKVVNASADPDVGMIRSTCSVTASMPAVVQVTAWGAVDTLKGIDSIASPLAIKRAIVRFGAVSSLVLSFGSFADLKYTVQDSGKVFIDSPTTPLAIQVDHAVMIVGWDESKKAWLVRNSTGPGWGYNGYAWIGYNTNNIGTESLWVLSN